MNKEIIIACSMNSDEVAISVVYYITVDENIQTICCKVNKDNPIPVWLNLRRFELRSRVINGSYMHLFDDTLHASEHTIQFMDLVYDGIMKKERLKIA